MKIQWRKLWTKRLWLGGFALLAGASSVVFMLNQASALAQGDGLLVYGQTSNAAPQVRTYAGSSNSFSSAGSTITGAQSLVNVVRTSPTKNEAIAGYLNSTGVLRIMCYDGSTWSNEWNVTVGGNGSTRAFDIAYETNSGDVMVLYGNNSADLGYQTKSGSTGCGAANWSSASTFTPARTTGTIQWVKMAWDRRGSSNLITAIWADSNSDLSSQVWSGSAWGNEYTSALSQTLEVVTAAQDVEDFDVEYESSSGDVMVVWADAAGGNGTNGARYATCTGGTSACTWSGAQTLTGLADDATNLDISADPNTDEILFASIGNAGADLQAGYWSGSTWTVKANFDTSAGTPIAGTKLVATGWLINGSTTRGIIAYNNSASTVVSYRLWDGSAFTPYNSTDASNTALTFSQTPAFANPQKVYDIQTDPFHKDRLMFTVSDGNADLFAKQLTMSATPAFTWTDADGGSALEANLSKSTVGDFSFAYWRYIPNPTYDQTAYGWYTNADSDVPGSILGSQNTPYTLTSIVSPIRLRTQLTLSTDPQVASTQAFKLQYATSTSGPWTDVGASGGDAWCNDTSGITCTTSWGSRRKITMDNSASGTNLTNFPLLVKVNSSRIDYSKTQNAGQDIRFVDASDPNTVLPYQIETWNESGDSYIWVKVPQVDAGSTTDYIWMYYDNASASDGQATTSVWDSSYAGVWHSHEASGTTMADSTSNANNATKQGATTPNPGTGQIGGAQVYSSASTYATVPDAASLRMAGTMTISAWVKASTTLSNYRTIACGASFTSNYCLQTDDGNVDFSFYDSGYVERFSTSTLTAGTWYYLVATYDPGATNQISIYINGNLDVAYHLTSEVMGAFSDGLVLGSSVADEYWQGTVDEIRVLNVAHSADTIKAEYLSQNDSMNSFGSEQTQASVASAVWGFYGNATPADGATVTSNVLTGTNVSETYQESNPTPVNPNAITVGQKAEWDFSLDPTNAVNGTTYYFRMTKSDGTALGAYTQYPQIIISTGGAGPTLDQQMRGGQAVVNGTKSPFSF